MKLRRKIVIVLLLISGVVFGFFQEYLKINVNFMIEAGESIPRFYEMDISTKKAWVEYYQKTAPQDFYHKPKTIEALFGMNYGSLIKIKWALAISFVVVYLILNSIIIRLATGNRAAMLWIGYLYIVFFGLALIIFLVGKLTPYSESTYIMSREILGGLQSLVPLMFMAPAIWLSNRFKIKSF